MSAVLYTVRYGICICISVCICFIFIYIYIYVYLIVPERINLGLGDATRFT